MVMVVVEVGRRGTAMDKTGFDAGKTNRDSAWRPVKSRPAVDRPKARVLPRRGSGTEIER